MAVGDWIPSVRGTISSIFRFGLGSGSAQLKNNGGHLDARNADDTGYINVRGATPILPVDLTPKFYVDSISKPLIVSRQADTSAGLPANTGVEGYVVVTTPGTGAVIGDILYDDGSGSGSMSILGAVEGRVLAITDALSGGAVTFDPDSIYIWDADGSAWVKIGDIGSVTGADRSILYSVGTATLDSASSIPANATVLRCRVQITTAYPAGATISVGKAGGTVDLLQTTAQVDAQSTGIYEIAQITSWGAGAAAVRATVGGAPGSGASKILVEYAVPNA